MTTIDIDAMANRISQYFREWNALKLDGADTEDFIDYVALQESKREKRLALDKVEHEKEEV